LSQLRDFTTTERFDMDGFAARVVFVMAAFGGACQAQFNFGVVDGPTAGGGVWAFRHGSDVLAIDNFGDTLVWSTASMDFATVGATPLNMADNWMFTSRAGVAMAWSASQQDLIEWDGSQWNSIVWSGTPPPAESAVVVGLPSGDAVLWGGYDLISLTPLTDTWILDSSNTWTQLSPATVPPWVEWPAFGADNAGNVLMFGGRDNSGTHTGDTWLWNGTTWSLVVAASASTPPVRRYGSLVFRPDTANWTLISGTNNTSGLALPDAWSFSGGTWTRFSNSLTTVQAVSPSGELHPVSNEVVYACTLNAVGTFNGYQQIGTGCVCNPPSAAVLTAIGNSPPTIGTTFSVDAVNYRSGEPLFVIGDVAAANPPTTFPLLPVGCNQYVSSLSSATLVNASPPPGVQSHFVPIANNTALIGVKVFFQFAQLPNGAFLGCSSNGVQVFVGR
jgi:hypothetical protein